MKTLWGGIEAGGTKFVCAVGTGPEDVRALVRIPTTSPEATLGQALAFFQEQTRQLGPLSALGIASFGPVELHPDSPRHGFITSTPKPGWRDTDVAGPFRRGLGIPVAFDTDVNGAALAEQRWGAARGLDTFIYLTVGTGIGGGALVNGQLLHGLLHPEMGHVRVPHDTQADPFAGCCPYHGDCLEGLASGPAMEKRWKQPAEALGLEHPAWTLEAHYIAQALAQYVCNLSPQRLILGGGVMTQGHLFPRVRREVLRLLNGYVASPALLEHIDTYIVPPGLGDRAGVLGALALGEGAFRAAGARPT